MMICKVQYSFYTCWTKLLRKAMTSEIERGWSQKWVNLEASRMLSVRAVQSEIVAKGAPVKTSKNGNGECSSLPNVQPDSSCLLVSG